MMGARTSAVITALSLLVLLARCAPDLTNLPCERDENCPTGLQCVALRCIADAGRPGGGSVSGGTAGGGSADGGSVDGGTVDGGSVEPSTAFSTLAADLNTVVANGVAPVTLNVRDAAQAPLAGLPVVWSSSVSDNQFSADAGTTNVAVVTTTLLRSTRAQQKTVTARIGTSTMTRTVDFTAGPPTLGTSSLVINPNPGTVDAGSPNPVLVTVTLDDAFGNAVSGAPVALSVSGAQFVFNPPGGSTNTSGSFASSLSSPIIQRQTVTATSGSVVLQANSS
jgi:hypothetical protein